MKDELAVNPLTATEMQLDFSGIYEPPFGAVGKTMNAIIGHRIAEVSVHRFVSDVAGYADADARTRALAAYKDFLTLWKDADPDIPILEEAKAEYGRLQYSGTQPSVTPNF